MEWGEDPEFSFFLTRLGEGACSLWVRRVLASRLHVRACPRGEAPARPALHLANHFVRCCVPGARAVTGAQKVLAKHPSRDH